ncbi:MAG: ABC transporter permease subunit [Elioraea sp.]|nr:ABC transporter permease subunit [Elioraea sp.]
MRTLLVIARRELAAYFATPVAYVFIVIFLVLLGALTFSVGNFFDRGQADLAPLFSFLPWLFLLLIPAITMRLWAEERRSGTIELLLTLPVALWQAVLGKFVAAWAFAAIALALTFPMVITVNVLGTPDNGVILAGYAGALLLAGCYLAIGAAMSALTRNQVIAFVLAVAACFVFTVFGSPVVAGFLAEALPAGVLEAARRVSLIGRYDGITRGVVALRDLVFFVTFIGFWLYANAVIVEWKKAG